MKTKELLVKLNYLKKVVPRNPTLLILESVCFRKGKLIACDLETGIELDGFSIKGEGCVNFDALHKAVKNIGAEEVEMKITGNQFTLKAKKRQFRFPVAKVLDFVDLHKCTKRIGTLDVDDIEKIVRSVQFTGNDELRPILSGVLIEESIVATDAHLLTYKKVSNKISNSFILPKNPCKLLAGFSTASLSASLNKNKEVEYVEISLPDRRMVVKVIGGKYVNYKAVIPKKPIHKMVIERKVLLESLSCALIAANKETHEVRMMLKNSLKINVSDMDTDNEFEEVIECVHKSKENNIEFGMNAEFIIRILKDICEDKVTLELTTPDQGVVINKEYLVMPLILN